jgi:ABC-2 type transport system permease protein
LEVGLSEMDTDNRKPKTDNQTRWPIADSRQPFPMTDTVLIARREYLERVRTRGFALSTVLIPAFVVAIVAIPYLFGTDTGGRRSIVIVDETTAGVGARIAEGLQLPEGGAGVVGYEVELVAEPLAGVRDDLARRVAEEEIDGYVHVPSDVIEAGAINYRARDVANLHVVADLQRVATEAVQAERLSRAGLSPDAAADLVRPVAVNATRLARGGAEGADALSTFFFAYGVAMLIYFLIVLYGQNVMRSVLEEKTSRIAEVIVSTVKASHLMMGKVAGVSAVALTQVAIWGTLFVAAATQTDVLAARAGIPSDALASLHVPLGTGLTLGAFFLLGFLLYASIYAAVGAAVSTEQEAQQLVLPVLLPLIVPLLFLVPLASNPQGTAATVLGLMPLTSPIATPMRMAATELPMGHVVASLALLALAVVAAVWLAGRVYRVGILSTGKRPSLRELARWMRIG